MRHKISSTFLDKRAFSRNNFDFLRFFAACQVIFFHTFEISGSRSGTFYRCYELLFGNLDVGVSIFFIISGFLIIKSRLDNPALFLYLKKRFLRIAPALAASLLFCIFVIGPAASSLGLKDYFLNFGPLLEHHLPRVFENNPLPNMVNGSLWTLKVEAFAYIMVACLGFMSITRIKLFLVGVLPVLVFIDLFYLAGPVSSQLKIGAIYAYPTLRYIIFFISGSLLYLYKDKVLLSRHVFLLFLAITLFSQHTAYSHAVSILTLPYLVIYFAYSDMPLNGFGKYGDFSYGLYIYAFPIQQTFRHFHGDGLSNLALFVLSFLTTLVLAVLSWKLIEKPALSLKNVRLLPSRAGEWTP